MAQGRLRKCFFRVPSNRQNSQKNIFPLIPGEFPSKYCAEYNELKKHFAQNTEPQIVGEFKRELMRRGLAEVGWMAGAGGGGFLYIWMAKGTRVEQIEEMIGGDDRWRGMGIWRVQMEEWGPMEVK